MPKYRHILEVLKFLHPDRVLISTDLVDKEWNRASESEELWLSYCGDEFRYEPHSGKRSYRAINRSRVCLALVKPNSMRLFNCRRASWLNSVHLKQSISVHFNSAVTVLSDGSVLVCGGWHSSCSPGLALTTVYQLFTDGNVRLLQSLSSPRSSQGMIEVAQVVYLFGGVRESKAAPKRKCEKLVLPPSNSLPSRLWTRLPNMLERRCNFNPSAFGNIIYLSGDRIGKTVERFDISKCEFSFLKLIIRAKSLDVSTSFIHRGDLVIMSTTNLTRWKVSEETSEVVPFNGRFACGLTNPMVIEDKIYILEQISGTLHCFDLRNERAIGLSANKRRLI